MDLDHGLLQRALWVWKGDTSLPGQARIEGAERRWVFVPHVEWTTGQHHLVVLSVLEDLAGNRIGRAFEVDEFDRTDRRAEPERFTVPFCIRPTTRP